MTQKNYLSAETSGSTRFEEGSTPHKEGPRSPMLKLIAPNSRRKEKCGMTDNYCRTKIPFTLKFDSPRGGTRACKYMYARADGTCMRTFSKKNSRFLGKVTRSGDRKQGYFLVRPKHLGITVNSTLSWSVHIKSVYINCIRKIGMLKRLKRKLHPSAFKRIYTGAIRPKMEYACTVWSGGPTSKLVDLHLFFFFFFFVGLEPSGT